MTTVKITGDPADIDEEMRPILKTLWANGVATLYSCAGHERKVGYGQVYLLFKKHDKFITYLESFGFVVKQTIDEDTNEMNDLPKGTILCRVSWLKEGQKSRLGRKKKKAQRDELLEILSNYGAEQ